MSNSLTKLIIGLYIVIEYLLGFASAYITCNYQITLPIVLCKVEFLIIITPGLLVGLMETIHLPYFNEICMTILNKSDYVLREGPQKDIGRGYHRGMTVQYPGFV